MLVGIHGLSRSGKDSIANYLVEHHGFVKRNLADAIRRVLLDVYDSIPDLHFLRTTVEKFGWDFVKSEYPWTVDGMISLGQGMREQEESIWISRALDGYGTEFPHLCIPDVRQPNEVEMILQNGGQMWLVERDETVARGMDNLLKDVPYEYIIENNNTLGDLETSVGVIMDFEILRDLEETW